MKFSKRTYRRAVALMDKRIGSAYLILDYLYVQGREGTEEDRQDIQEAYQYWIGLKALRTLIIHRYIREGHAA